MQSVDLKDSPFYGRTSTPAVEVERTRPECLRCGSALAGRRQAVRWSTVAGVTIRIDVYRCRCGRGRHLRRPLK